MPESLDNNTKNHRVPRKPRTVIEIGVEVTKRQTEILCNYMNRMHIPFYVEPARDPHFMTLDELEADCEGK